MESKILSVSATVTLALRGTRDLGSGSLNLLGAGLGALQLLDGTLPGHVLAMTLSFNDPATSRTTMVEVDALDASGRPLLVGTPPAPLRVESSLTVDRGRGQAPDRLIGVFLVEIPAGLPLQPGPLFWRVTLDGESRPEWTARLDVLR